MPQPFNERPAQPLVNINFSHKFQLVALPNRLVAYNYPLGESPSILADAKKNKTIIWGVLNHHESSQSF